MVEEFINEYDIKKNLNFDSCRFRPAASFSSPFGMDNTFEALRIHAAIDRGYSIRTEYEVYTPFDIEGATYLTPYGNYGALFILPVKKADFDLRIAHMELKDISPYFLGYIKQKIPFDIMRATRLGEAGNLGLSSGTEIIKGKAGAHTHTELVSREAKSEVLEDILYKKFTKEEIDTPYTERDVKLFALSKLANEQNFLTNYKDEIEKRKISFLNGYKCIRIDYMDNKEKTFYNSQALFGF